MKKKFFFFSGLPRSGSTVLASILNQHPELYVTPLSPTVELLYYTEKYFEEFSEGYAAYPEPLGKRAVLENITPNYYSHIKKPYIMDNNRAWPNNIEYIQRYIDPDPKIVCVVRDIPSILASFIDLINRSGDSGDNFIDRWLLANGMELNISNRCYYLMQPIGIVNQSLWSMHQAYVKGYQHRIHLVEYDNLSSDPVGVLNKIIEFLGIKTFNFDFNNIINITPVDDATYNLKGMHDVRKCLGDRGLDPVKILGSDLVETYSNLEFWRQYKMPVYKYNIFGLKNGRF